MMFAHVAGFCAAACFLSGFDASKIHAVNTTAAECQPNDDVIALAEVAEASLSARQLHQAQVETSSLDQSTTQKGGSDMCKTKDQCWYRAYQLQEAGKKYKTPDQASCVDGRCKATGCGYNFAGEGYSAPGCYYKPNDCVYWNNDEWDQDGFNGWSSHKKGLSCFHVGEENEPCDLDNCFNEASHNGYLVPPVENREEGAHPDCKYAFNGDYSTKGCFVYKSDSGRYANCAFFGGTDGAKEDQTTKFINAKQERFCWRDADGNRRGYQFGPVVGNFGDGRRT